jgi:hypothetical protein
LRVFSSTTFFYSTHLENEGDKGHVCSQLKKEKKRKKREREKIPNKRRKERAVFIKGGRGKKTFSCD